MKAIAVIPGRAHSAHLKDVPKPSLDEVPNGRGVLVKVLRVGVDGTDKDIQGAGYGKAPAGCDYLIEGHESLGRVEAVGPNVREIETGDYVTATVRRPGSSIYDKIGTYDMTTDEVYYERGINLRHGFLTEYYVDDSEYIVCVPARLKEIAVLMEPSSVAQKAIAQAYRIQQRLHVWHPSRACVLGTGSLGLLSSLFLRLRGLEVTALGLDERPYLNADLLDDIGAHYESTREISLAQASDRHGPFDLILEETGYSPLVFEAMNVLARNGVLVMLSVTGGDRKVEIPADKINLGFVFGNKVAVGCVNANREYFESGVRDLSQAELQYPGWLKKLLTNPIPGLDNYQRLFSELFEDKRAIKVFCEVAPLS